jgi:hypothetical protein
VKFSRDEADIRATNNLLFRVSSTHREPGRRYVGENTFQINNIYENLEVEKEEETCVITHCKRGMYSKKRCANDCKGETQFIINMISKTIWQE